MTSPIPENFYVNLGNSGLKVSKIILGCMGFGSKQWAGDWILEDDEEIFKVMKASYDAGIRTFDTADIYSGGLSEEMVGKFLKRYDIPRESIVIMSKCFGYVTLDQKKMLDPNYVDAINRRGLSRKHIMDAVDLSVERLGTYIDLLQIHRYDPDTPEDEIMRALNDVVESGKVRYIGASSMYAYQFIGLQNAAEKHGWHKFISMQNLYHLLYREEEREMIPYCKKTGVGIIPWSPIGGGVLAKPRNSQLTSARAKSNTERNKSIIEGPNAPIIDRVEELSKKYDVSMAVIATAWNLSKGCLPIMGITKIERISDAIKSTQTKLSDEDIKYLDELYQPVKVQGHF